MAQEIPTPKEALNLVAGEIFSRQGGVDGLINQIQVLICVLGSNFFGLY